MIDVEQVVPGTVNLAISSIRADGDTQPRVSFNHDVIADYAQQMMDGAVFPPVTVFFDGKDYWLADGFHRVHAVKRNGHDSINANIKLGSLRDARLYSVGVNATHGLHRSNEDKRRCVRMLLEDEEWCKWSDREIARRCGVGHELVGKLRQELSGGNDQIQRYVERNGSIYTITASNIGHSAIGGRPDVTPLWSPIDPSSEGLALRNPEPLFPVRNFIPEPLVPVEILPLSTKGVESGQVWRLGRHLLYCGDSSSPVFIDLATQARAAFVFADPPYNANVAEWDANFTWHHDYLADIVPVVAVTPGISAIKDFMQKTTMPYKWSMSYWIDNGMTRGALGFGNWIYVALFTESSLYRNAQDVERVEDMERVSITGGDRDPLKHKGRKPIEMVSHIVNLFTKVGETVIDPFLGSGTTLIACAQSARVCIGAEIDPEYCESIIRRWERLTGREAEVMQ